MSRVILLDFGPLGFVTYSSLEYLPITTAAMRRAALAFALVVEFLIIRLQVESIDPQDAG